MRQVEDMMALIRDNQSELKIRNEQLQILLSQQDKELAEKEALMQMELEQMKQLI